MPLSEWVHTFREVLCCRLNGLELGDYSSAVSANLPVLLESYTRGDPPDEVAERIYAIELKALSVPTPDGD